MNDALHDILEQVRAGSLDPAEAGKRIRERSAQPLGFATVDHDRAHRCGSAEVIYAAGKTPAQVVAIARAVRQRHPVALITRAAAEHVAAVREAFASDKVEVGSRAGTVLVGEPPEATGVRLIPIITAGTSDEPVAEEAELTCKALGHPPRRISDVGVAGLHRLGNRLSELRDANVIVCIAGMEGALPSVVGGLVDVPVIAVPTSVGYGAAFGGIAALLGMLTSCASGVSVVNIDNGFGAAYNACLINRVAARK
jgi:NCAIR mutase (PurE)-related protein